MFAGSGEPLHWSPVSSTIVPGVHHSVDEIVANTTGALNADRTHHTCNSQSLEHGHVGCGDEQHCLQHFQPANIHDSVVPDSEALGNNHENLPPISTEGNNLQKVLTLEENYAICNRPKNN